MDAVKRATACLNEIRPNAPNAEKEVIDRLLGDELEMSSVWEELDRQFPTLRAQQFFVVIDCIVGAAAHNSLGKLKAEQGHLQDAKTGLEKISKKAQELAGLLRAHRSHCEKAQVSGASFDVIDCLDRWSDIAIHDNSRPRWLPIPNLYRDYVRAEMESIRLRFDGKYWPCADDLLDGLAVLAEEAELTAGCSVTAASRLKREVSARSFIYALLEVLHGNSLGSGPLPPDFELKPKTIATITNCALGLIDDQVLENNATKAIVEFKKRNLTTDL